MMRATIELCKVKMEDWKVNSGVKERRLSFNQRWKTREREREWVIVDRPNTEQRDNWCIPVGELLLNIIISFLEVLRQRWWPSTAEENSTLRGEEQQCHFFGGFWWYFNCVFFGTGQFCIWKTFAVFWAPWMWSVKYAPNYKRGTVYAMAH